MLIDKGDDPGLIGVYMRRLRRHVAFKLSLSNARKGEDPGLIDVYVRYLYRLVSFASVPFDVAPHCFH